MNCWKRKVSYGASGRGGGREEMRERLIQHQQQEGGGGCVPRGCVAVVVGGEEEPEERVVVEVRALAQPCAPAWPSELWRSVDLTRASPVMPLRCLGC